MTENTKIEWATHTWNPWYGCSKVSPACDHCYAEVWAKRGGRVEWGGARRRATSTALLPYRWDALASIRAAPTTVFCLSLGDIWDKDVPPEWRDAAFDVISKTPHLTWLLLSKRIGNAARLMAGRSLPPNVALGATVIDQAEWDRDAPKLAAAGEELGASFTFASVEPMLGPIVMGEHSPGWVICGGESGHFAREMNPDWARSLRDQCAVRGTPFFMKQMTAKGAIPTDLLVRQFPAAIDPSIDQPPARRSDPRGSGWLNHPA